MSTLGQMNPTESSRPISRCFCKLVSGEKKRCFTPLHPVTCKRKLCTVSFGFFCLPETNTTLVSNQVLAQIEWSLEWAKDKFACCLHRTMLKPVPNVPWDGSWEPSHLQTSKYGLESPSYFLHSGCSWLEYVRCKPWTPRAYPFQLLALAPLSHTQLISLLSYIRDLPGPHHCSPMPCTAGKGEQEARTRINMLALNWSYRIADPQPMSLPVSPATALLDMTGLLKKPLPLKKNSITVFAFN